MELRLKRVYDDPTPDDGFRVLVDRLWPRGLTKAAGRHRPVGEGCRALGGAAQGLARRTAGCLGRLRGGLPGRAGRGRRAPPSTGCARELREHAVATLVFAAHDPQRTHALVLRDALGL